MKSRQIERSLPNLTENSLRGSPFITVGTRAALLELFRELDRFGDHFPEPVVEYNKCRDLPFVVFRDLVVVWPSQGRNYSQHQIIVPVSPSKLVNVTQHDSPWVGALAELIPQAMNALESYRDFAQQEEADAANDLAEKARSVFGTGL